MRNPGSPLCTPNYGRITHAYCWLEYVAFGRELERARSTFLSELSTCDAIAVFGAGDGRCFHDLLPAAPHAKFVNIDLDPVMNQRARELVSGLGESHRVSFIEADARLVEIGHEHFDGVVTQFFLDCFTNDELDRLIPRIRSGLKPGAPWLFADFNVPNSPRVSRWRAEAYVSFLCAFFRWKTGHVPTQLPAMDAMLRKHGFHCEREQTRSWGLLRSAAYRNANGLQS